MSKHVSKRISITVLSIGLMFVAYYFGSSLWHLHRMHQAKEFLPVINRIFAERHEFSDLTVLVAHGSHDRERFFYITGSLRDSAQVSELRQIIFDTKPPVSVFYKLKLINDEKDHEYSGP